MLIGTTALAVTVSIGGNDIMLILRRVLNSFRTEGVKVCGGDQNHGQLTGCMTDPNGRCSFSLLESCQSEHNTADSFDKTVEESV